MRRAKVVWGRMRSLLKRHLRISRALSLALYSLITRSAYCKIEYPPEFCWYCSIIATVGHTAFTLRWYCNCLYKYIASPVRQRLTEAVLDQIQRFNESQKSLLFVSIMNQKTRRQQLGTLIQSIAGGTGFTKKPNLRS